jgi:hypothetical protein
MFNESLPLNAVILLVVWALVAVEIVLNLSILTSLSELSSSGKPLENTGFTIVSGVASERSLSELLSKIDSLLESVWVSWVVEKNLKGCLVDEDAVLSKSLWMSEFNISSGSSVEFIIALVTLGESSSEYSHWNASHQRSITL